MSEQRDIKSFGARCALQQIERSTKDLNEELRKLDVALDERVGVVKQLLDCPLRRIVYQSHINNHGGPERAKAAAISVYAQAESIEAQNLATATENKQILERLKALIVNAGISAKRPVQTGRGWSSKTKWVDSDWVSMLSHGVPVATFWGDTQRRYSDWIKDCDKLIKQREDEEAAKVQAEERRIAQLKSNLALAVIAERHGLPVETPAYDVLYALLQKDKYLRLAHGMQMTRGDWSDGPWATRDALRDFVVVGSEDAEMVANIQGHLDDWDGDGRIFRDCLWNYGRIFGLVADKQLLADYETVNAMVSY